MEPHPDFAEWQIPRDHDLGSVRLRALGVADQDRDYAAVMESAADIRAANPDRTWPDGLTAEENFLDLAWHQREFDCRRSFAWVIEDGEGAYLGCLYVYPSLKGEKAARVRWWWRTGTSTDREAFRADLEAWLAGPGWPRLAYRLQDG